jgi:F-type H+-transporting ATPase subunit epsilon
MHLKILLPFKIFADITDVIRIVAETQGGAFGLLPNRLDCVAALVPGVLTWQTQAGGEVFAAVDDGTLIKTGHEVVISVRRALQGRDLSSLRAKVDQEFLTLDEAEQEVRAVMAKLETGFVRRFAGMQS